MSLIMARRNEGCHVPECTRAHILAPPPPCKPELLFYHFPPPSALALLSLLDLWNGQRSGGKALEYSRMQVPEYTSRHRPFSLRHILSNAVAPSNPEAPEPESIPLQQVLDQQHTSPHHFRPFLPSDAEMKFSHSLQFNSVPDWADKYLA